ncbi:hypothetical protein GN278_10385 [Rhodobacteraceae bacterium Araon29]
MSEEQKTLDVEAIVDRAFEYFDKLMKKSGNLHGVLLEGLEPKDNGWIVSIGFDGGVEETSQESGNFAKSILGNFNEKTTKTTKTIRLVRCVHLDNQGNFEKLT